MPHSSRVGLDRQDILSMGQGILPMGQGILPMGQGILPMVREAEGMEGFKVHVQIIENDWDRRLGSIEGDRCCFCLLFSIFDSACVSQTVSQLPGQRRPASA